MSTATVPCNKLMKIQAVFTCCRGSRRCNSMTDCLLNTLLYWLPDEMMIFNVCSANINLSIIDCQAAILNKCVRLPECNFPQTLLLESNTKSNRNSWIPISTNHRQWGRMHEKNKQWQPKMSNRAFLYKAQLPQEDRWCDCPITTWSLLEMHIGRVDFIQVHHNFLSDL